VCVKKSLRMYPASVTVHYASRRLRDEAIPMPSSSILSLRRFYITSRPSSQEIGETDVISGAFFLI
jgi:hypothetical protein